MSEPLNEQLLEGGVVIKYQGVPYVLKNPTVVLGNTPIESIPPISEPADVRRFLDGQGDES